MLATFLLINYMADPIGNVPAFISVIKSDRKTKAIKYLLICFFIIISFTSLALFLFYFFKIAILIFKIVASIILLILGIKILFFHKKEIKKPLLFIISLYSGPGVITTAIFMMSKASCIVEKAFVFLAVFSAMFFSWLSIALYEKFERYFGKVIKYAVKWKGIIIIIFASYFIIDVAYNYI